MTIKPTAYIQKRYIQLNKAAQRLFPGGWCNLIYINHGLWVLTNGFRFKMDKRGRLLGSDFTAYLMSVTSSRGAKELVELEYHLNRFILV